MGGAGLTCGGRGSRSPRPAPGRTHPRPETRGAAGSGVREAAGHGLAERVPGRAAVRWVLGVRRGVPGAARMRAGSEGEDWVRRTPGSAGLASGTGL